MTRRTTMTHRQEFAAYRSLNRGAPFLWTSPRKGRKTMTVSWSDGTLLDYHQWRKAVDTEGMNAALLEVWQRYKPQCWHKASFGHGSVIGGMSYVPIAAGLEAAAIVRDYFTRGLERLPAIVAEINALEARAYGGTPLRRLPLGRRPRSHRLPLTKPR